MQRREPVCIDLMDAEGNVLGFAVGRVECGQRHRLRIRRGGKAAWVRVRSDSLRADIPLREPRIVSPGGFFDMESPFRDDQP